MFGEPGHAYVYFTYGMHFCVNLVCRPEGTASAVLLRAGRVIEGIPLAAIRRAAGRDGAGRGAGGPGRSSGLDPGGPGRPGDAGGQAGPGPPGMVSPAVERELARGPARLCQALGIDRGLDGADACDPASPLRVRPAGEGGSGHISRGPRVGISAAAERPWRFWLTGDPTVSPYRPHVPRTRRKPVSPPAAEDGTIQR
jgi:DNA-3-methyladenine glycosylase